MLKMRIIHFVALVNLGICYSVSSTAKLSGKLQPRIIRGYTCNTAEFPFFVMIDHKGVCGGSLLTYEWVLTAAHCIIPEMLDGKNRKVYSGFDMSPQLTQVRNIKEVHIHPNWNQKDYMNGNDFRYDIGLILVDKPFSQTKATRVATLPAHGFTQKCSRVITPGIGRTYQNEIIHTERRLVKCVNLDIVNANSCKNYYARTLTSAQSHSSALVSELRARGGRKILFDDTILCANGPRKGICRGDSGGPVLCDNVVIGINSYGGDNCELLPIASTFTMVEKHLGFIEKIVKFTKKNVT